jgi:uncharacterized BrkB/YihY/UPF0761 family membrane protein
LAGVRIGGVVRCRRIDPRHWRGDQLLGTRNVGLTAGAGEQPVVADAMKFYALLALFPGIAALVSIYGLFADPTTIVSHLDTISGFAPGGAIDVPRQQLTRLAAQGGTTLGVSFLVGLVISLWSANSGSRHSLTR